MISIGRNNECVVVRVETDLPRDCEGTKKCVFTFSYSAGVPWAARLLTIRIDERLRNRLREIREVAYEAGWKDAKAKQRKKREFSRGWDTDIVGW